MIMTRDFHYAITDSRFWSRTYKTAYFVKTFPTHQLYILNVYDDGGAMLDNSDIDTGCLLINDDPPEITSGDEERVLNEIKELITNQVVEEGYHEISEEEFMKHVDELFPRWRELKFNKKTKEMYYPEEVQ